MPSSRRTLLLLASLMISAPACLAASHSGPTDYEKGAAAFQKKDYVGAIDNFEKALAKQPNNANVCYGLASAFSAVGQRFQALNFYRQCLALAPHSSIAENAQKGIDYLQSAGGNVTGPATAAAPKQNAPSNGAMSAPPLAQAASPPPRSAHPQPDPSASLSPWQRLAAMAPPLPPEAQQTLDSAQSAQSALQPPAGQGNAPFAMGKGHKGQRQQQSASTLPPPGFSSPYGGYGRGARQSASGSSQAAGPSPWGYGGGWPGGGQLSGAMPFGRHRGLPDNQQSGSSGSGPFSFTGPQQDPLGLGGGPQGRRYRHQMQPIGGFATSYNFGSSYGHVPTMVVREYSFPPSLNKSDDEPILVELMAKQQRLVIDGPVKATPVEPNSDTVKATPLNSVPSTPDGLMPTPANLAPSTPDAAKATPSVPEGSMPTTGNSLPGIPDAVNPSP